MIINGVNITIGTQETDTDTTSAKRTTGTEQKNTASKTNGTSENDLVEVSLNANTDNDELSAVEKQYKQQIMTCMQQIQNLMEQLNTLNQQQASYTSQLADSTDIASFMNSYRSIASQKNQIYSNITNMLVTIKQCEQQMAASSESVQNILGDLKSATNSLAETSGYNSLANTSGAALLPNITSDTSVGDAMVSIGNSFVGIINSDAQGNKEFSPGGASQHWCADFVTSITKRAFQATGKQVPAGFGSSSVSGLANWGKSNGRFIQVAGQSNKAQIIANNIKPGDILIQQENGASHTGIVTKVYPDGSYDTVEGNSSDAVKNRHYTADNNRLTGFVRVT